VTHNGTRPYTSRLLGGQGVAAPPEYERPAPEPSDQHKALQVLTMAQRTADEHVATARREAEHIRGEARAAAAQIIAEAQAQAGALRDEAEKTLARARASAERTVRDSETLASQTEQNASGILADARGRAEEIVQGAEANAHDIKRRAQQIYDDVVGGLSAKREALQQQIETLEQFEREYRTRLTSFMQQQLRALWVDQPPPSAEVDAPGRAVAEPMPEPPPEQLPAPLPEQSPASRSDGEDVSHIPPDE